MPTNDEIKKKYNIKKQQELLTLEDLERIIGTEGFNGLIKDWNNQISLFLDDLDKMLNEARAEGYKEGQRETITRILMLISRGTLHSVDKAITDVIDYCKNTEEKVD